MSDHYQDSELDLDEKARASKLEAARDLIRSATLADSTELFVFVNTLIASCEFRSDATAILIEASCDMENLDRPKPEMGGFDKRGDYDGRTQNVRHRHD